MRTWQAAIVASVVCGCGSSIVIFDAGSGNTDAGSLDAGTPDAGAQDAGAPDAGLDAGSPDAGGPTALTCPGLGQSIALSSGGVYLLQGTCAVSGIHLSGSAELDVANATFTVDGDILLEDTAALRIVGGSFTLANHRVFEHQITAHGSAILGFSSVQVSTNAGVAGNTTASYTGDGQSVLDIANVTFDYSTSWLLANVSEHAVLSTTSSANFPSEIYPSDSAQVQIEGANSNSGIWFLFPAGSTATLSDLPAQIPFSYSFGVDTPGVSGIDYEVNVVNGNMGIGIYSLTGSNVTISNNTIPIGIDYIFGDVTAPESISSLRAGLQSGSYTQDRTLTLDNASLSPLGWQVYVDNGGLAPDAGAPVTVTDSQINELAAFANGKFEVSDVSFAFAVLGSIGPHAQVHVSSSTISSQTILTEADSTLVIEDSRINGALVQATGTSQVTLINDTLAENVCNSFCLPMCLSLDGSPPVACNPFNPSTAVQLAAADQAVILVAGIDAPAAAAPSGATLSFTGDALAQAPGLTSFTYSLSYSPAPPAAASWTTIVSSAAGPIRGGVLGTLSAGVTPGNYLVELDLEVPGQPTVTAQRPFAISP